MRELWLDNPIYPDHIFFSFHRHTPQFPHNIDVITIILIISPFRVSCACAISSHQWVMPKWIGLMYKHVSVMALCSPINWAWQGHRITFISSLHFFWQSNITSHHIVHDPCAQKTSLIIRRYSCEKQIPPDHPAVVFFRPSCRIVFLISFAIIKLKCCINGILWTLMVNVLNWKLGCDCWRKLANQIMLHEAYFWRKNITMELKIGKESIMNKWIRFNQYVAAYAMSDVHIQAKVHILLSNKFSSISHVREMKEN